jgi:hypothetical protein
MSGLAKEVFYTDSEGLDFNDLHDMQRFARSALQDFMIGPAARSSDLDLTPSTSYCFSIGSGALPYPGASALQVKCKAGSILQSLTGTYTGSDPDFLLYRLALDEINVTLSAGDPTNPR